MEKDKETDKNELRSEYKSSDFPGDLVRNKYAKRLKESSNIVVLRPEVAQAFPNEEAVDNALLSLDILRRGMLTLCSPDKGAQEAVGDLKLEWLFATKWDCTQRLV